MNLNQQLHSLQSASVAYLPRLALGIVVFLAFWLAAILVKRLILRVSNYSKHRKYLLRLLSQTAKITVIIIGLISGLGTLGVNVMALVTSLGLVGFALGFALKDSLSNLIAGFLLLFYHPFQINDTILLTTYQGTVVDINLRYTTLHFEDKIHMVPNSTMINNIVTVVETRSSLKEV